VFLFLATRLDCQCRIYELEVIFNVIRYVNLHLLTDLAYFLTYEYCISSNSLDVRRGLGLIAGIFVTSTDMSTAGTT